MKYLIPTFILLALLLSACQPQENANAIPEKLEDKRALLKEKRTELSKLTEFVDKLEKAVAEQDPTKVAENRPIVTTVPVERTNFKHFVEIQAAVEADDYVDVTSEVAGRITKLTAEEGDDVRRGQLIAELDLDQLKKQMAELEKSLELANTVFERQKRLWDQNIGSEIQYLEAKNNKERLEKSVETLEYQMSKAKIYAPASGVVETVFLQTGELASPGMPIIQILNPRKLKAVADVPENYLRAIKKGDAVTVEFPALDQEQRARITLIGRTIDPANRTFKVEAALSKASSLIKPNLLAVMYIQDEQIDDVVTIPLEMVQQEVGGKDYVYVLGEGEGSPVARKVYVETGDSYDGNIVIKEGLEGGETLIMEGARGLAENEPVKVKQQG
ncbi:MAG: efflux RND transporter periplasmic adaptor subunit [Bacteroidetes bacterium]|jgi:RND family efflux transporter MFP subunit|nr:efflux RND transporter periplasmic adaptor subunit [Bacteroidota bacterium]